MNQLLSFGKGGLPLVDQEWSTDFLTNDDQLLIADSYIRQKYAVFDDTFHICKLSRLYFPETIQNEWSYFLAI